MISGIRTHILIGSMEVLRCPRLAIVSRRHAPLSRAKIVLPDAKGELIRSVSAGESVEVRLGYRDQEPAVWRGTVAGCGAANRDQVEVQAVGQRAITEVTIKQVFENETPEAIVRYAVRQAGLTTGRIDAVGMVFPRFVASGIPVWQVARQCAYTSHRAFGIDMSRWALWMGKDGAVNWGDFDEPGEIPVIATGAGLIRHLPGAGAAALHRVETFLLPGFMHSRRFSLIDRRRGIDDTFRALAVVHEITPGSARTCIEYGEEYGLC